MSHTDEAWTEVSVQLRTLGVTIKNHYDEQASLDRDESVSPEEVKDALSTLGESLSTAFDAVGAAFRDPEVTREVKDTAASFFDALGVSFSEIGAGMSSAAGSKEDSFADLDEATESDPSEDE